MRDLLLSAYIFFCISCVVIVFHYFAVPTVFYFQVTAFLLLLLLFCISLTRFSFMRKFLQSEGKLFGLFVFTLISQLIVHSTGGIFSQFFILFDLLVVALSFAFSFSVALGFSFFSIALLIVSVFFDPEIQSSIIEDPVTPLLFLLSFLITLPLSYVLAQRYRLKEKVANTLRNQISTEDAILEGLPEMMFVTDERLRILSVNDAAERSLHRAREEVQNMPIFQVVYLKTKNRVLLTEQDIHLETLLSEQKNQEISDLQLMRTTAGMKKVTLQIRPIVGLDNKINQLIFIVRDVAPMPLNRMEESYLALAVTKHQAMIEDLRVNLQTKQHDTFATQLMLISKAEKDILTALMIDRITENQEASRIDLAHLAKHILHSEQDFATSFHVPLDFSFINFGKDDITPLITGNFEVTLDSLTGPFFTVPFAVKPVSSIIQKVLLMGILLSSTEKNPLVQLSLEREEKKNIILTITAHCPMITAEHATDLFIHYYGHLNSVTNLHFGSGLEGYLAKKIADSCGIPIEVNFKNNPSIIIFRLIIPRETNSVEAL
jgi:PAS domain S-box-containing protein